MQFCMALSMCVLLLSVAACVERDIRIRIIENDKCVGIAMGGAGLVLAGTKGGTGIRMLAFQIVIAVLIGVLLLIVSSATNAMGGGDIKMIAAISVALNVQSNLLALFLACCASLLFLAGYRIVKKAVPCSIPFAPFIALGYLPFYIILWINFWRN